MVWDNQAKPYVTASLPSSSSSACECVSEVTGETGISRHKRSRAGSGTCDNVAPHAINPIALQTFYDATNAKLTGN